jgi:hypothetical protein
MKQLKVLTQLGAQLNEASIRYSLGGSLFLFLFGINASVNDVDITVHNDDKKKLENIITKFKNNQVEYNPKYQTRYYYSISIDGIDIDILIDFIISSKINNYFYPFHVERYITVEGVKIPLASLL